MPTIEIDSTLTMFYEDFCFADPWRHPETVLLVHGIAESNAAWFGWVPYLAREFRVLAPDLRGFGKSSVPPKDFRWSVSVLVKDLENFLDALQIQSVHIIGAKMGGSMGLQLAAQNPGRIKTLTALGAPARSKNLGGQVNLFSVPNRIREVGVRKWASDTQRARLGSEVPEAHLAWWTDLMSRSNPDSIIGFTRSFDQFDIFNILKSIQAPTLIVTTDQSPLQSVESVREIQKEIPNSELLVLPGDSYHIAAARPDECAKKALEFIRKLTKDPSTSLP